MHRARNPYLRPAAGYGPPGRYRPDPAGGYGPLAAAAPAAAPSSGVPAEGAHPLFDLAHNRRLLAREGEISRAFDAIEPALRALAALPWDEQFVAAGQALVRERLGFELPARLLETRWIAPLDMRAIYVWCVEQTFRALAERDLDRGLHDLEEGEPAAELIRRWGFHAIDITPCADGRLSGVVDYILRVPPAVVTSRKSFAGAMFDVEESVRNWATAELHRYREAVPNPAGEPTRYLKIGVYHTSSSDPAHEGCAAHGSDAARAAAALLERLQDFARAVERSYPGAAVATLLIGVDTDTDAITVHVPDADGRVRLDRFVDNRALFEATRTLAREQAKDAIRAAVAEAAGVAATDRATEGMRWFCGYLLKNNMAQIEYVRAWHRGRYADLGHTERFITVGDSFDDVQMRNLAYQAQMDTLEEGAADMDVGIKIFRKVNMAQALPIPVFIHFRYDDRVPGARARAVDRGRRLERAIQARYPELAHDGWLHTRVMVRSLAGGSRLEDPDRPSAIPNARASDKAETTA